MWYGMASIVASIRSQFRQLYGTVEVIVRAQFNSSHNCGTVVVQVNGITQVKPSLWQSQAIIITTQFKPLLWHNSSHCYFQETKANIVFLLLFFLKESSHLSVVISMSTANFVDLFDILYSCLLVWLTKCLHSGCSSNIWNCLTTACWTASMEVAVVAFPGWTLSNTCPGTFDKCIL